MTCTLWVHNADRHTTIRADRLLALRVTIQPGAGEIYAAPPGRRSGRRARHHRSAAVLGERETFPEDVPDQLAA